MKMWEHKDLCLSVGKINAYRNKGMSKEVIQWINELQDKLKDLKEHYERILGTEARSELGRRSRLAVSRKSGATLGRQ